MVQHEIGLKAEMLGGCRGCRRWHCFDYEITNIEVSSSFLGSFGGFGSTVLEGTQEARGVEFELIGEILPGWNVSANYAYMDAEINNPNNTNSTPPRTTPKHSGAITTTYEFLDGPAAGLRVGGTVKVSGDYSFIEGTSNVDRFGSRMPAPTSGSICMRPTRRVRAVSRISKSTFNWQNVFDEDIMVAKQGNPGYGIMFIDQQAVSAGSALHV
ncbi:MAG: TonB-dependent receptor [Gammaproteobacteria bacterium]|nr:TonB-dependent receptor [Gammaproteobacteria bacterium]